MNRKKLIYILLIILAIGIYYYQYCQSKDTENIEMSAIDLSLQPIYQSEQMLTAIYDPLGNLSYKITATDIKHFNHSGDTLFQSPNITLYYQGSTHQENSHQSDIHQRNVHQRNIATWQIRANNATLTHDKQLFLHGQVQLENLLPDAQLEKIITQNAQVDLATQIVTSQEFVTIQGAHFTSTGTGLLGNLRNKTANILENVKTYYNVRTNETNSTTDKIY